MLMFVRAGRRNVLPVETLDIGPFGDRFLDVDSDGMVAYRTRRLPFAAAVSFTAGVLASFIGIGGGILIVPVLNTMCGVPMRVAAATSVLMIGITAVPGVAAHWAHGFLGDFRLAGIAALGVLVGCGLPARQPALAADPRDLAQGRHGGAAGGRRGAVSGAAMTRWSAGSSSPIEQARLAVGRIGFAAATLGLAAGVVLLRGRPASLPMLTIACGVLLALPVVNVVALAAEEIRRRDWPFVVIAVAVIGLLAWSVVQKVFA
jgi:uncharacterized membrane protein YfcA